MDWVYLRHVKYGNFCLECDGFIDVGDRAYWQKNVGIMHTWHVSAPQASVQRAVEPARLRTQSDTLQSFERRLQGLEIRTQDLEREEDRQDSEIIEFSWAAFNEYVESKKKIRQLTFPFCQRCGNTNDIPAVELCERCAVENVLSNWDTYVSDIERKKHDGPWHPTRTGYARRIVSRFRGDPKIRYEKDTPGVIQFLSILDGGERYTAVKNYGMKKGYTENNFLMVLVDELDGRLIDRSKRGNELYEVDMFQPNNAKILRYRDPSTGEIYAQTVDEHDERGADINTADAAMAWKFWCSEEEYDGMRIEA